MNESGCLFWQQDGYDCAAVGFVLRRFYGNSGFSDGINSLLDGDAEISDVFLVESAVIVRCSLLSPGLRAKQGFYIVFGCGNVHLSLDHNPQHIEAFLSGI